MTGRSIAIKKQKLPLYDGPVSAEDVADVLDNPEWTQDEFDRAKPFAEVFPELADSIRRTRGKQKAPTKQQVTLRIERGIVDAFKATGRGWQTRMEKVLKAAIQ